MDSISTNSKTSNYIGYIVVLVVFIILSLLLGAPGILFGFVIALIVVFSLRRERKAITKGTAKVGYSNLRKIFIGALIIFVLFFVLLFVGSVLPLSPCHGQNGFFSTCVVQSDGGGVKLSTNGIVSLQLAEDTAPTMYNVMVSCIADNSSTAPPNNEFRHIGNMTRYQNYNLTLTCYNVSSLPDSNLAAGTQQIGYLWVNYTVNSTAKLTQGVRLILRVP